VAGRRWPRLAVPALLFDLSMLASTYSGQFRFSPEKLLPAVALLCLVGTLAVLVTRRYDAHRLDLIRLLLVLLAAFQLVDWIANLFQSASERTSHFPILQAVVVLLGLLWDAAMSGEAVTNVHGRRVPRHSRVFLYFGYQLLAACTITWHATTEGGFPGFEADLWVASGLQALGTPLLMLFFALGVLRWRRWRPVLEGEPIDRTMIDEAAPAESTAS
jgi:hypothetical protein